MSNHEARNVRRATIMTEVDPLPPAVKKHVQKQSDSGGKDKEHADKEFLELVRNEYLIREGKYDFNIATIGAIICDEGPS